MTVRWSMRPSTYDRMMRGSHQRRYFENSGYFNFGYWGAGAKSQPEASEALVDQMVARIANRTGRILDVACGLGGSTKRLTQTYAPERPGNAGSYRSAWWAREDSNYVPGHAVLSNESPAGPGTEFRRAPRNEPKCRAGDVIDCGVAFDRE